MSLMGVNELREFHHCKEQNKRQAGIKKGDVVLVKDENVIRGKWKTAVVEDLIESNDGEIRGASVRLVNTKGTLTRLKRPLQLLYPIEVNSDEDRGALHQVIHDRKSHNEKLSSRTLRTYTKISATADEIFESLKLKNTAYFKKFYFILKAKWFFMLQLRPVDRSLIESHAVKVAIFNEKRSDHCITEIAGSRPDKGACKISDGCWKMVTTRHEKGYALTHQALYFIIGIKRGCKSTFIKKFGGEKILHRTLMRFGANIYSQMITKYNRGHLQKGDEQNDIFTEYIFVCQLLGVDECFDSKLLHLVVSWQDQNGCWKIIGHDSTGKNDEGRRMFGSSSYEDDINDENRQVSRFSSRKLLIERLIGDGCSIHLTSVATGMLGMSVYGSNLEMQRTTSARESQRSPF